MEGWNSTIELHLHFCVFPNDSYYNTIGYYFCQYKFKIFSKIFLNKIFASNLIFINKFRFSPKIPRPHWAKNFERLIKYFYALGWAFLYSFFIPGSWNCMYTCVDDMSECPSIVCIAFRSAPFCNKCVAKECLNTCGVMSFSMWACSL